MIMYVNSSQPLQMIASFDHCVAVLTHTDATSSRFSITNQEKIFQMKKALNVFCFQSYKLASIRHQLMSTFNHIWTDAYCLLRLFFFLT